LPYNNKVENKRKEHKYKEEEYLSRLKDMQAAFRKKIDSLPIQARQDAGIQAVQAFLDNPALKKLEALPVWSEVRNGNSIVTFRLLGDVELVCQRPAVVVAMAGTADGDVADGVCLVSGNAAAIERLHPAIKGVWGAQTSGANIVSFNLVSSNSFGKDQGTNAPLGKPAVFAYTTALNSLLARDSRQRIQVGDASTVFWAEEAHDLETALPDLFGEPPKDDPHRGTEALKVLYRAVQSGKFTRGQASTSFNVLGLAPNASRIAIRFWETAPAHVLARRIAAHFDDIRIARGPYDPEHLSVFQLLTSLAAQGKAKNIPPNLGGEVMRAILEGVPYPRPILNLAVQRCRAEQNPTYARAAVIKASLNRLIRHANLASAPPEKEFKIMLDLTNAHPAYRLGRLFATLEKVQEEASPGLNATIRDRYYGAASSTPVAVFTTLLRLKNHHLGHLQKGRAVQMERLIVEIMGGLEEFPRILTMPDQGRFALGYYHQRQAFFTRSETKAVTTEESK
ncbi:MAG: type I-C CRISPR-associated protein Cas8c/Csd1, partial [Verrucomicrobia bacterium]|nr:type I-C CRISPR-associated protein Cas8c/Csd1 [Verrucomicrobiota bacterium]